MEEILEYLNNNNGIAILISSISVLISAIAVVVALYYNSKTQKQYKKSLEPQLSMRIDKIGGLLYLLTENTGRTAAKNIKLKVRSIEDNGTRKLMLDKLFSQTFELYSNETVQAMVAISGENFSTGTLYPRIIVDVSYQIPGRKQQVEYSRTVTFSKIYDTKVHAEVKMDLRSIESSLKSTARATVRTANYLDGNQVAEFDEKDILAGKSLRNDMCEVIETGKKVTVKDHSHSIQDRISKRKTE